MVKIVDRLLLFIYSLIVFAASLLVLFVTFAWIDKSDVEGMINDLYVDDALSATVIAITAVALLISIRFLYVALRRSRAQAPSIDQRTDFGDIRISLETVENLSLKAAGRTKGVKDLRARVKVSPAGLEILIRTVVDGESSIPDMTEEMQNGVKRYIEDITGIPVASVTVFVANIVQSSPTFRSRVE